LVIRIPYLHQRLASVELKPAGSLGGMPVSWPYSDDTIDVTPENEDGEAPDTSGLAQPQEVVMLGFSEDNDG
jgi:hypothetical protein